MVETDELEEILKKCRIIKKYAPLPASVLGYYSYDGDYYVILINESIRNNEMLYRTVLAEEIGHYRTTIGDITPRMYMSYRDRIGVDKKELIALKWAADFLIPTDLLLSILKDQSFINFNELLEIFCVTKELLLHKLKFMAKERMIWKIDDNRKLSLLSLPSVYMYEEV